MEDEALLLAEIAQLKQELAAKEARLRKLLVDRQNKPATSNKSLTCDDIVRFSRQIILPQIGVDGSKPAFSRFHKS
jgi:hypothetical protein